MVNDLRKKTNKELGDLIIKLKNQLLEYRFKAAVGQLDKTHKVKIVKKTIAISLSILSERNVSLSISSHNYALIEMKDGKTITKSIGKGFLLEKEEQLSTKSKNTSKELNELQNNKKETLDDNKVKIESKDKQLNIDSSSTKKPAPKKIVTKSKNNQAKKSNIVKKAQRGV